MKQFTLPAVVFYREVGRDVFAHVNGINGILVKILANRGKGDNERLVYHFRVDLEGAGGDSQDIASVGQRDIIQNVVIVEERVFGSRGLRIAVLDAVNRGGSGRSELRKL